MRWLLTAWLLWSSVAWGGDRERWLLAIGVHEGTEDQDRLRHAVDDAQRFADVLHDLGGIDRDRTLVLADGRVPDIRGALGRLAEQLAIARQNGDDPEVIVYYSGHSDDRGLTPHGDLLTWNELRVLVRALPARMRIAVLDSCASGAFVRGKGGTQVEGFLADSNTVEGEVFLTSASADEAAQESDRLGGSFFTHHLIVGLRGAADANLDQRVTLQEAYDYAYDRTVSVTEMSWAGTQHPTYAIDVRGRGDVVITDLSTRTAVLRLDEGLDGAISVRDADGALVAELDKLAGESVAVAVAPGRYTVRLRRDGIGYRGRVTIDDGTPTTLSAAQLDPISLQITRLRGASPDVWSRTQVASAHLAPRLGTYGFRRDVRTTGLSLNLFGVEHAEFAGFEVGGGSWSRGDVDGLSLNGVLSGTTGRVRGWQAASFAMAGELHGLHTAPVSRVINDVDGLQISAFSWTGGRFRGAQWGGFNIVDGVAAEASAGWQVNFVYGRVGGSFRGLQMGFVNDAERVHGLQWGVFNASRELRGLQLGLVNIVTENSKGGETLGAINIVKDGYTAFEFATDGLSPLSLRIKTGSRHLYSVFRFGLDPSSHDGSGWTMGGGLGGHVRKGRFVFDGDYVVLFDERSFVDAFTRWPSALTMEWGLSPGVQLTEGFAVFAGGSLGFGTTVDGQPAADTLDGDTFTPMSPAGPGGRARWFGNYHVGVRIQL